ncbi:unnamed protein product [Arctia plantaginis]|uniref:Uncharacterized protein n=1 Tax=Arctia plantaginis TaxID=874455 RepID=A0A8S1AHP8_ARCPL|nr:unnamed protein product [Arctia plantaginis]
MAPQELEGATLGEKHRSYNKRLQESQLSVADIGESDIGNLLKIDIACQNKNVEYILKVLKGEDMLYVARALTRCTWLYTDNEYANIVNPDYLQSEIFPNMNTKSIIMFKKQIRRNIRDESRAEQFYLKEIDKSEACKWLPYCSVAFIENNIEQYVKPSGLSQIKLRLFKRLCEKSITIFEIIMKHVPSYAGSHYLKAVTFLLNTNTDKYMDILESSEYQYPKLNHKSTDLIMKHSKTRVIEKIDNYIKVIHIPTFVKYLEVNEIKNFLTVQAKKKVDSFQYRGLSRLFRYDTLKYFIYRLPKEEQFDFVKKVCMRENEIVEKEVPNMDTNSVIIYNNNKKWYDWYQFAQFDNAFDELTKLISQNVESREKLALLTVLVKCAKQNLEHIQTILNYYINKHMNEDESSKIQFVTEIIRHTHVSKYDDKTWSMLNKVFKSRNIYKASPVAFSCNTEVLNFIIIYNALNDQETPEEIKKQFMFNTLKSYNTKMNQAQKDKVFNYLYELSKSKMSSSVTTETDFTESLETLSNILKLLKDWNKQLVEYPLILNRIKELIQLKKEHSYKASLSKLYNINKSWRKHMFEESIGLSPCEEVCLNALKHEPQLLVRHSEEMGIIKKDDTISLKRFLSKLRIYWPQSLAQEWIELYFNNINDTNSQKAAVRGIVAILPQKPFLSMIEKYQPVQAKIDWKQADDRVISVQRLIAKNMHRARPQPPPDAILGYAKGDYLQFALPSLLAIFYNVKFPVVRQYVPKLLDSPVSLQKHGIRLAFKKLDREELKSLFLNCWKSSKNTTIRSIIFKYTHTLLCNEKEATNSASLWELLEIFIDNLTFTEDKDIYKLFSEVSQVPICIRAKYLIKGYNFLQKLIPTLNENDRSYYELITTQLAGHSRVVMETISSDFVISLIQEYLDKRFFNYNDKYVSYVYHSDDGVQIISAYLLCSKTEDEQIQKYQNVFAPLMRRSLEKWGEKSNGTYFVRKHFYQLLTRLCYDLKDYVADKNMLIPLKMFTLILDELEKNLPVTENYIILTKWKLAVAFAKLTQEHSSTKDNNIIPLEFGKICLKYLKKDVEEHFPCIYVLFSKCVKQFLFMITPENAKLEFYEGMLSDKDFIQGYLAVIEIALDSRRDLNYKPLWKQIVSHPSVEIKMHYYNKIEEKEKETNYAF